VQVPRSVQAKLNTVACCPMPRLLPVGETMRRAAVYVSSSESKRAAQEAEVAAPVEDNDDVVADVDLGDARAVEAAASAEVRPPPGLLPPPGLPSHGSVLHGKGGTCKPCAWFWKPSGCSNGLDCLHCHLCPKDEISERRRRRRQSASKKQQQEPSSSGRPRLGSLSSTSSLDLGSEVASTEAQGSDLDSLLSVESSSTSSLVVDQRQAGPPGIW